MLCGALCLSLGLHGAALAALALVVEFPASGPQAGRGASGGAGPVFVELLREGDDGGGLRPAAATLARSSPPREGARPTPRPAPPPVASAPCVAKLRPVRRSVAVARASEPREAPSQPHAPEPRVVAVAGADRHDAPASPAAVPDSPSASGAGVGAVQAPGPAFAGGTLWRVARPISTIRPHYPDAARERGDEGEVIVEAWVAASGRVERAQVRASAGPEFDAAALEAIHEARFHPAWQDGEPVASVVAMRLHFELER